MSENEMKKQKGETDRGSAVKEELTPEAKQKESLKAIEERWKDFFKVRNTLVSFREIWSPPPSQTCPKRSKLHFRLKT